MALKTYKEYLRRFNDDEIAYFNKMVDDIIKEAKIIVLTVMPPEKQKICRCRHKKRPKEERVDKSTSMSTDLSSEETIRKSENCEVAKSEEKEGTSVSKESEPKRSKVDRASCTPSSARESTNSRKSEEKRKSYSSSVKFTVLDCESKLDVDKYESPVIPEVKSEISCNKIESASGAPSISPEKKIICSSVPEVISENYSKTKPTPKDSTKPKSPGGKSIDEKEPVMICELCNNPVEVSTNDSDKEDEEEEDAEEEGEWEEEWVEPSPEPEQKEAESPNKEPCTLEWSFGFNVRIPIVQINKELLLIAAAHLGIIYNTSNDTMIFLKGQLNMISSLAMCNNYLAISEKGEKECLITLWNKSNFKPLRSLSKDKKGGIHLMTVNSTGEYLAAVDRSLEPMLYLWNNHGTMLGATYIDEGLVMHLTFDNEKPIILITYTGHNLKVIYQLAEQTLETNYLQDELPFKRVGQFQMSCFTRDKNEVITGTSEGNAIVWSNTGELLKMISLAQTAVSSLQMVNDVLMVAFKDGVLKLYNQQLQLITYQQLSKMAICSLTFPNKENLTEFAFSDNSGCVSVVNGGKINNYLYKASNIILSLDCHPQIPTFITGDDKGYLTRYHITTKQILLRKEIFCNCGVTYIKYSPSGNLLAIGSEQGDIMLLDTITLSIQKSLPSARAAIIFLGFMWDDKVLAYIHRGNSTGTFKFTTDWHFRGKFQAHDKNVTSACIAGDRLFSVAEDRMLVEFQISHCLRLVQRFRIEMTAIPTSVVYYKNYILAGNSEGKMRFIHLKRKEILKTIRAPGRLHLMLIANDILLFAADSVIGATNLPIRGWSTCVMAHPTKVSHMSYSHTGRILTTGINDATLFQWTLNIPLPNIVDNKLPYFIEESIRQLENSELINVTTFVDCLRFLGYFPSKFDILIIKRDLKLNNMEADENTLRQILLDYAPPPYLTVDEISNAALEVSNGKRHSNQTISMEKLVEAICLAENVKLEEATRYMQLLFAPKIVPTTISLHNFINDILGIDYDFVVNKDV